MIDHSSLQWLGTGEDRKESCLKTSPMKLSFNLEKMTMDEPIQNPPDLVMLIDDDPFMLSYLADMLGDLGVSKILKLLDARSALRAIAIDKPTLLICDLSMPDMDGIEFLNNLAGLAYQGGVLLHSGVNAGVIRAAEKLAKARGLHVIGAFEKPISRWALRDAISTMRP